MPRFDLQREELIVLPLRLETISMNSGSRESLCERVVQAHHQIHEVFPLGTPLGDQIHEALAPGLAATGCPTDLD